MGGVCRQVKNNNSQEFRGKPPHVSCCPQLVQREEVGDGAAVAAGEQRAAVHGPAGVCRQHRALEEAVLSLQGGERPAEGKGSRAHPQESLPSRQLLPLLLFVSDLCGFLAVCVGRWSWSLEREVDGEFRQLLPSAHSLQGGRRAGAACEVPYFRIWETWCQQGLLAGVRNQKGSKSGAAVAYPFQSSLKYCQIWMS